ncbi:hypothetical protein ACQE3E_13740 [Methylomonas sp. MED-D]|uniref:hypothetical protein n=1 Tax=unclassified Methylomonas TaxID=2608980 RepID=UPI000AED73C5|nr:MULTISPECIES: hypothetical protein [unclassified Methylomonas]MDT4331521.1 hypothetical protein [Methylomonas sp. MV1]
MFGIFHLSIYFLEGKYEPLEIYVNCIIMKRRYQQFNNKRVIKELTVSERQQCKELAKQVKYVGNPEHKQNPGDFGLTPPSGARPGKSLCDAVNIFSKRIAQSLLKLGLQKGLVSERYHGDWPQNIWSVTEKGEALEAQLDNKEQGTYHGYPMPESDPMANEVIKRWKLSNG